MSDNWPPSTAVSDAKVEVKKNVELPQEIKVTCRYFSYASVMGIICAVTSLASCNTRISPSECCNDSG